MYNISKRQEEFIKAYRKKEKIVGFFRFFILIAVIIVWEFAAKSGLIDEFIFSSPSAMAKAAINMAKSGDLFYHISVTAAETIVGFLLGTAIGSSLAVILWWNKMISDILQPYLVVLNSLPKTALAPIIIVWLGNNTKSIILIALLTSVIITIMTVLNGFLETDKDKMKLITILGGSKRQILTKVVIPSNVPVIFNALKINVLIHIGIDTVQLDGKYFTAHIEQGQRVERGQLLVEADMKAIEAEGYDTTIMVIITNTAQFLDVIPAVCETIRLDEECLSVVF